MTSIIIPVNNYGKLLQFTIEVIQQVWDMTLNVFQSLAIPRLLQPRYHSHQSLAILVVQPVGRGKKTSPKTDGIIYYIVMLIIEKTLVLS